MRIARLLAAGIAALCCWGGAGAAALVSPDEIMTEDQLRPGMKGVARSVFEGTKIESFPVTVLGVLEKIDFGANIILIRIDGGTPVSSGAGLSAGMSGSPVFVNGKLIGAISLSWPFAKQPVGGVTPIRQMLESFAPGSAPKAVGAGGTLAPRGKALMLPEGRFTRAAVGAHVEPAPGVMALRPLATPVFVSGMSRSARRVVERLLEPFGLMAASGPGRMSNTAAGPPLQPGSAVGVQLMRGDIDISAIGTVTWVKGKTVLAFGHPLMEEGPVDLPMTAAYVHGVVASQEISMKLASPLQCVGRLTEDRPWCVGGTLGDTARMIPVGLRVADADRKIERRYAVEVVDHRGLTQGLAFGAAVSAVASLVPPLRGTTTANLVVKAEGLPEMRRASAYASGERGSPLEMLFGVSPFEMLPMGEMMEILEALENNPFGRARLSSVELDVRVSSERRSATIAAAASSKRRAKPGDEIDVTVQLQPYGQEKVTQTVSVRVPQEAPSGRLQIGVSGGKSITAAESRLGLQRPEPTNLQQLARELSGRVGGTDLIVDVVPPSAGVAVAGEALPAVPGPFCEVLDTLPEPIRRAAQDYQRTTVATPFVLSGSEVLSVAIEADEKDKAGPPRVPQAMFPGAEEFGEFFGSLFRGVGMAAWGATARARRIQAAGDTAGPEGMAAEEDEEAPLAPSWDEIEDISRLSPEELKPPDDAAMPRAARRGKAIARPASSWKQASAKDFSGGKREGTCVRSDGRVMLAPEGTTVFERPGEVPWALAVAGGKAFVGCWPKARVYEAAGAGEQTPLLNVEGAGITALAAGANGELFAAVAPAGEIRRLNPAQPEAPASVLCRLPDAYVWALASRGNDLYAATGPQATLYRIDKAKGEAQAVFRAPDRHIIAMALDGQGNIYVGTYPRGKLYRVARDGKAEPVYEVPDQTIQSLAVAADGAVYVGTSPKGQVWRIVPGGAAKMLLDAEERHIFALVPGKGGVLAAAGGRKARVYRVGDDGTNAVLYEPMATHVAAMLPDGAGGLFAAVAGSGRLVHLQPGDMQGTFTSSVHDAQTVSDWGRISWEATVPEGCSLSLKTRSGNTAWPDKTWSDWSADYTSAAGEAAKSPPARYFQYRCVVKGAGQVSPSLERVQLLYMTRNRAPEVKVTGPASGDVVSGRTRIRWQGKDPDKDTLTYQVFYSRDQGKTWSPVAARVAPAAAGGSAPKRRTASAKQTPTPPAKTSGVRKAGEEETGEDEGISEAEEGLGDEEASRTWADWDTKRVKDGACIVKVTAGDAQSNPGGALTADDVSHTFVVDNTVPTLVLERAGGMVGKVVCRDAATYITSAEYRVDSGNWAAAACEDGVFDSPQETLLLDPAKMPSGSHKVEVRARDAAGNEGTASAPYVKGAARPR